MRKLRLLHKLVIIIQIFSQV